MEVENSVVENISSLVRSIDEDLKKNLDKLDENLEKKSIIGVKIDTLLVPGLRKLSKSDIACLAGELDFKTLLPAEFLVAIFARQSKCDEELETILACPSIISQYAAKEYKLIVDSVEENSKSVILLYKSIKKYMAEEIKKNKEKFTFSPLFARFLKMCIEFKYHKLAISILEEIHKKIDFTNCKEKTGVTVNDYLLFYYYASIIYINAKAYKLALFTLSLVIPFPLPGIVSSGISPPGESPTTWVQIESYKKYLLVFIIQHGFRLKPNGIQFPVHIQRNILFNIQQHTKSYEAITTTFYSKVNNINTTMELQRLANDMETTLLNDGNKDLMRRVLITHQIRVISSFRRIYSSIPIDKLYEKVYKDKDVLYKVATVEEFELFLARLIADNKLQGCIYLGNCKSDGSKKMCFKFEMYNILRMEGGDTNTNTKLDVSLEDYLQQEFCEKIKNFKRTI